MTDEFEKNVNEDLIDESETYPVMPLRNTVLFPQQVIPIYIGRDKSLKLINELSSKTKHASKLQSFKNFWFLTCPIIASQQLFRGLTASKF